MTINYDELAAIRSLAGVKRNAEASLAQEHADAARARDLTDNENRQRKRPRTGGRVAGQATAAKTEAGPDEKEIRVAPFVQKLAMMLDSGGGGAICWDVAGASFWVNDPVLLEGAILPQYFKHNRMAFFVKQLRAYGFKQRLGQSSLDSAKEWFHEQAYFYRGAEEAAFKLIQRASSSSRAEAREAERRREAGTTGGTTSVSFASERSSAPRTTNGSSQAASENGGVSRIPSYEEKKGSSHSSDHDGSSDLDGSEQADGSSNASHSGGNASHSSVLTSRPPNSLSNEKDDDDDGSHDGSHSSSVSYSELQADMYALDASIQLRRSSMHEQRLRMMTQIERIMGHLRNADHPIHRKPVSP